MPDTTPRLGHILAGFLLVTIASLQALGPCEELARIGALAARLY